MWRWHDEEVRGSDLMDVILQKRAPGLRRRCAAATMYFATVAWQTSRPSFNHSP